MIKILVPFAATSGVFFGFLCGSYDGWVEIQRRTDEAPVTMEPAATPPAATLDPTTPAVAVPVIESELAAADVCVPDIVEQPALAPERARAARRLVEQSVATPLRARLGQTGYAFLSRAGPSRAQREAAETVVTYTVGPGTDSASSTITGEVLVERPNKPARTFKLRIDLEKSEVAVQVGDEWLVPLAWIQAGVQTGSGDWTY